MDDFSAKVQQIEAKVDRLAQKMIELKAANSTLEAENNALKTSVKESGEQFQSLEARYKDLKLARAVAQDDEEKRALKLKLNSYIREIDRCIGLLNA